jgi:hypothetical protein
MIVIIPSEAQRREARRIYNAAVDAYHRGERNPDGTLKHIVCEGARFHVTSWGSQGARCSEAECEVNLPRRPRR